VAPLERSGWDQAEHQVVEMARTKAVTFLLLTTTIFGGAGANATGWLEIQSVVWRSLVGALVGLGTGLIAVLLITVVTWMFAPAKQRDEAQTALAQIRKENEDLQERLRLVEERRDVLRRHLPQLISNFGLQ
jgi:cbb3-type cytochrome oxidase subunit 3